MRGNPLKQDSLGDVCIAMKSVFKFHKCGIINDRLLVLRYYFCFKQKEKKC